MAIIQCENGHNYDSKKHPQCPYCAGNQVIGVTVPLYENTIGKTQASKDVIPNTMPIAQTKNDIGVTQPYYHSQSDDNHDFVVGWLICIEGNKKGKSFPLHNEKNFIGKEKSNDVCLDFDTKIAPSGTIIISYDSQENQFYIQTSENQKNNVKLNQSLLLVPVILNDNDTIKIGNTKLLFKALCNDNFQWE
ncbi:FHA domain-containing protein [Paludicola sp. MB14-C6]|uniref:FHA domain-containing protein n=1 Tax=Paludihabitans sp. MB14-C6 TaxID=3070656 RepID=UPI0027DB3BD2|nr:FHA domain-containing protein [Paludicola sp. MB14-C6]WMJ22757.1 FHA domain-containing protein [Paludicola sp. MB14-C6]